MGDAKDILGLPKVAPLGGSVEKRKTPKDAFKKPDGVSREVRRKCWIEFLQAMLIEIEDGVLSHNSHFLQSMDMDVFLHLYVCVRERTHQTVFESNLLSK